MEEGLRILGRLVGAACILVVLAAAGGYAYYRLPNDDRARPVQVTIAPGDSPRRAAERLAEKGVIRAPLLFLSLARLQGKDRLIRAGEYRFHTSMTPEQVLERLCRGVVVLHRVTIPEGWTVAQIAAALEREGLASREAILEASRDPELLRGLGIEGPSLEGYLFPDTYRFAKGLSAREILRAMVRRFHEVYDPRLRARQAEAGWSLQEVVTLASIVEKETGRKEERPLVARVLINRLRKGMPLQCDPTVIYGIEGFDGNLTREDLRRPTPYNTYVIKGLPPGPICNPGLDSLRAVLYPAEGNFLYFVSRNDGTHRFSTTLREHNEAVRRYQIGGGRGVGKAAGVRRPR